MVGVAQRPAVVEWKGGHNVTWDACSKNAEEGGREGERTGMGRVADVARNGTTGHKGPG